MLQASQAAVAAAKRTGNALTACSDRDTLWQIGLFSNKAMLGAVLLTFALQLAVIYVPFLSRAFSTTPLSLRNLLVNLGFSVIVFIAIVVQVDQTRPFWIA